MSVTSTIEYDDVSEHTFDSSVLELSDDKAKLKSQVLGSEVMFANYDTDDELTSKRGSKEVTLGGVANTGAVLGGLLQFPNEDRSIATYSFTELTGDFAFRFKVLSNIASTAVNRNFARLTSSVDSSQIVFYITNQGAGVSRIWATITSSSGATSYNNFFGSRTFATTPNFNIALNYDADGNLRIFLDGVSVVTISAPTFDFSTCTLVLGSNQSATDTAFCDFDNVQVWSASVFTSSGFSYPVAEATTYVTTEQVMRTDIPLLVDQFISFSLVAEVLSGAQLKHFITLDGDDYVHNGSDWVLMDLTSALLDQANTVAEISANLSTIPVVSGIGKTVQIGHVFKSDAGYVTPEIESLVLKYSYTFKAGDLSPCVITGVVTDGKSEAVEGAKVWVITDNVFVNNTFLGPNAYVETNPMGKFSISVPSGITVTFIYEFVEQTPGGENPSSEYKTYQHPNKVIPALPTAEISTLEDAA